MSAKKDPSRQDTAVESPHFHVLAGTRQYIVVRQSHHIWRPPTDVMEEEGRLHIVVEIAGMQKGEFHVTVSPRALTISGVRPSTARTRSAYHQLEVRHGEFRTDVALPWPVDEEGIAAHYSDGFLHVELPRARIEKIRIVPVNKPEET